MTMGWKNEKEVEEHLRKKKKVAHTLELGQRFKKGEVYFYSC